MPIPSVFFTDPADDLVLSVADRLDQIDAEEARLMSGVSAREAMLQSVRDTLDLGGMCKVCMIDGSPELVCGACRDGMLSDSGQIWMLRTDVPARWPKLFMRYSAEILRALIADSGDIEYGNWCLAENVRTIRWLQRLGFVFDADAFFNGHMWRHFRITEGDIHGSDR